MDAVKVKFPVDGGSTSVRQGPTSYHESNGVQGEVYAKSESSRQRPGRRVKVRRCWWCRDGRGFTLMQRARKLDRLS